MTERQTRGGPEALMGKMDSLVDPTRLRILLLLDGQELGVAELCEVLQLPQSTVSRHLKHLSERGWVRHRRRGTSHLYRMSQETLEGPSLDLWRLMGGESRTWPTAAHDALRLKQHLARRPRSEAFFAEASSQWDKMRREYYGESYLLGAALAMLPAGWTVADLGCGTGQLVMQLARHVNRVIGVDRSPEMLAAAHRRVGRESGVELLEGELEELPLGGGCCDAALMLLVLTYLPAPEVALGEAARILRPGGRLVIVDLMRHDREDFREEMGQYSRGFDAAELETALERAGLASPRSHALPPEPQAKGPALLLASGVKE